MGSDSEPRKKIGGPLRHPRSHISGSKEPVRARLLMSNDSAGVEVGQ